jgi:methylated-DNA-[protein]-cysteine S-methyltransferase
MQQQQQHYFDTPVGICRIDWQEGRLTAFRLPEATPAATAGVPPGAVLPPEADGTGVVPAWVREIESRVLRHLSGEPQEFDGEPYDFSGVSDFQRQVYRAALQVKAGRTETYGGLARRMGFPVSASRAVGTALGQNPWPLLVPCHRFIGANGKMTGFSAPGGIETKLRLLAIEGVELFPFQGL